jgi:hypothetical protein
MLVHVVVWDGASDGIDKSTGSGQREALAKAAED